jgi:bacterioferritin-associated ferredoxin
MYVCICHAVVERQIREAIAGGTDTWKKLCRDLKVATQCGTCAISAKQYFEQELAKAQKAKTSGQG